MATQNKSVELSRLINPASRVGESSAVITSTSDAVRDGIELMTDGIDTGNYEKNPVVLWMHDNRSIPVARATNIYRNNDDQVVADFEWNDNDDFARQVRDAWRDGFLNATSVSFMVHEWTYNEDTDAVRAIRSELLEFSIVTVPADPGALATVRSAFGIQGDKMTDERDATETRAQDTKDQTVDQKDLSAVNIIEQVRAEIREELRNEAKTVLEEAQREAEAARKAAETDALVRSNYVPENFDIEGKTTREILQAYTGMHEESRNDDNLIGAAEMLSKIKQKKSADVVVTSESHSPRSKKISATELKRKRGLRVNSN